MAVNFKAKAYNVRDVSKASPFIEFDFVPEAEWQDPRDPVIVTLKWFRSGEREGMMSKSMIGDGAAYYRSIFESQCVRIKGLVDADGNPVGPKEILASIGSPMGDAIIFQSALKLIAGDSLTKEESEDLPLLSKPAD